MTKAIVLYNSRGGNTKKVAMKIAEGLGAEVRDHKHIPKKLDEYELVVVGSWVIAGRISFAGARYLRSLKRKNIAGKKVALFFTSGAPEEVNPMAKDEDKDKLIKDIMFESMENILAKSKVTILQERFCCKGATRIRKNGEPKEPLGHPSEEELTQAKAFGEQLRKTLS